MRLLLRVLPLVVAATTAWAQGAKPDAPAAAATATPPEVRTPDLTELMLAAPRPLQALGAALGLGRQRLALVVGNGSFGSRQVLTSAPRDAQAVAAVLRAAGFVVMVREDLSAADLRASLKEFRERLQPGGVGFVFVTAIAAQVQGQNLWLPREATLDAALAPADLAARLGQAGVPVAEIVDALLGPPASPRLLVLDAAYRHPALARLPQPGLAEQPLPPGMMALFSSAPGATQDLPMAPATAASAPATAASAPARAPPGATPPGKPVDGGASPFARALVAALGTPRITGADALRATRRSLFDGSQGRLNPWLAGDTDSREELAESTLVDSLMPRTPEDAAREAAKQTTRRGERAAGEQTVAEVLQASANTPAPLASTLGTAAGVADAVVGTAAGAGAAAAGGAVGTAVQGMMVAQAVSTVAGSAGSAVPSAAAAPTASLVHPAALAVAAAAPRPPPASPAPALPLPTAKAPTPELRTTRVPGGGERPAYTPRTNAFGYAEGDTFTYQVTDSLKGEITGAYTTAIEEVLGDGQLLANGKQVQMDAQGRLKTLRQADGSQSSFEPAQELWWSNPQRGESRDVLFTETFQRADATRGQTEWKGSASVGRPRKMETAAGAFEVLPIESSGWFVETLVAGEQTRRRWSRTAWYATQLGHPVAIDIEDADATGKLLRRERVELIHAQSARGTP